MSVDPIARKDFRDAVRSRTLWVLSIAFVGLAVLIPVLFRNVVRDLNAGDAEIQLVDLISFLIGPVTVFVPLIGVAIGYKSIAGERQSGSIKLLLSLPHTREDVLLGKFLGRFAVLMVPLTAAFAAAAVVVVALFDSVPLGEYALFFALTMLLGAVYVSIAVGVSAATSSTFRAALGGFGLFVLFQFAWSNLLFGLYYLVEGRFVPVDPPDWFRLLRVVNPGDAYLALVNSLLLPGGGLAAAGLEDVPFYLQDWFVFLIVAAWIAAPLGLGYLAFRRQDI